MAERSSAQNIVVAKRGGEPPVQARPCATVNGSPLDDCATLAVNDPCSHRDELDGDATRSMSTAYIEVENMTAAQTMVEVVGFLPCQEAHRLVCVHRN